RARQDRPTSRSAPARTSQRAVTTPHVAGVRQPTESSERAVRAGKRQEPIGERRQTLHQRRGEHEQRVPNGWPRRDDVEPAEKLRRAAGTERQVDETLGEGDVLVPRGLWRRGCLPTALGELQARDGPGGKVDLREHTDLVVRGETIQRRRERRGRREVKIALLEREGERSVRLLVGVDDHIATEQTLASLADGPARRPVALERPRHRRPEKARQRQDVRAAERSADDPGQSP